MQYFVCQINDRLTLGAMDECSSLEEALELVKRIVQQNSVDLTPEVLEEIENDYGYVDEDMQWLVQVGIVGSDNDVREPDGWVFVDDETEEEVGFADPDEYANADHAVQKFGNEYGDGDFGVYFRKDGQLWPCSPEDTPDDFHQ